MTDGHSIVRTTEVALPPDDAFDVFTSDMHLWFQNTPYSWNDPKRAKGIRFETGLGGRIVEVWDEATGEGYDWGRVTKWEPGKHLVLAYRCVFLPGETEIEVHFEPIEAGTRVTLEHRGFEKLPREVYDEWKDRAWHMLMKWYSEYSNRKELT